MIKISVIIPIYNMSGYIGKCIEGILKQSLKEIEIICVDDGSQDESRKIIHNYAQIYNNIKYYYQDNMGAGPARNKGIQEANGKYLCFMDADDYYAGDEVLEKLYNCAEENNVYICGGNYSKLLPEGTLKYTDIMFKEDGKKLFKDYGNPFNYGCYIFLTKMIKDNNIFFPNYRRFQDPPFLTKAMVCTKEFYGLNINVYTWRVGYKKVDFSREVAIDVLKGIKECFLIAEKNNLIKMYDKFLKDILFINLRVYCKYALNDDYEIWKLIDSINEINKRWRHCHSEIVSCKRNLALYIKNIEEEREAFIKKCNAASEIIIYGAGNVGQFIVNNYKNEFNNIIGFAVTKMDSNVSNIEGYEVKEIEKYILYHKNALVVVATGKPYQIEILKRLAELKFENIYTIDNTKLTKAEEILKSK